jgi:REP element-mobilizing transposase RayT
MQLAMDFSSRGWGGARKGAGRPRSGHVSHVKRAHKKRNPVHVTVHALENVPSLRSERLGPLVGRHVRAVLGRRNDFRIVVFSIQRNHLHLIVEADDQRALTLGLQGFLSGLARRINHRIGRRGRLWRDRYHAHEITSPSHTRNVLRYVLQNTAHHGGPVGIDPLSSATWFDGFAGYRPSTEAPPVARARTWLLSCGWHLEGGGLLGPREPPSGQPTGRSGMPVTRPLRGLAVTPET